MGLKKTLSDILGGERKYARKQSADIQKRITTFLADNKGLIVIVADPETDTIVAGYGDQLTANRLVSKSTKHSVGIVKSVLEYNKEDKTVKNAINQFLLMIDASIYTLAKNIKSTAKNGDVVDAVTQEKTP